MVLSFTTISVVLGTSRPRGAIAVTLGPRHGRDRHRRADRPVAHDLRQPRPLDGHPLTIVLVSLFAVGEIMFFARRSLVEAGATNPLKGAHMDDQGRLEALLEAGLRGHRPRLSHRRAASRRLRDPDLPVLRGGKAPLQASGGVSATVRSKVSPGRKRPNNTAAAGILVPLPTPSACRPRRPPPSCSAPSRAGPAAGAAAAFVNNAQPNLGAHCLALYRQCHADRAEPTAGRHVGTAAAHPAFSRSACVDLLTIYGGVGVGCGVTTQPGDLRARDSRSRTHMPARGRFSTMESHNSLI